ncbi:MAG: cohesin domain-containing protein [Anaeromassilibacillus sp.]|nr:cohesin domain-containing protein [Anaeromassilibacillus sp.]MDY3779722.1 cohesin domain-containing protein [Candidatus Limousia pullorum]
MKIKMLRKTTAALMAAAVLAGTFVTGVSAEERSGVLDFTIDSPYASVDWDTYGQYKADFHAHSNESDGSPQPYETIEEHYKKGYDILALTDHNVCNTTWNRKDDPTGKDREYLTDQRLSEITYGTDRDNRGMVAIMNSDEQSVSDHLNTFFTPFNNEQGATLESNIAKTQELGGICHINHPGRYTGGRNTSGTAGEEASNNPETIKKYTDLFMKYDAVVGMEIINKLDGDSYSDRILWDNILKETMPEGRFVWGFSNDDTHSTAATGHSYNMMLLPSNNPENVRESMENGTFYASAKVAKREGYTITDLSVINDYQPPIITNIQVDNDEDTITIDGEYYNQVEWIADGKVIATGNTIDLNDHEGEINSYVRAQLKGDEGISFTQPFGVTTANSGNAAVETDKELAVIENGDTVTCTVKLDGIGELNSFDAKVSYDSSIFEIAEIKPLVDNVVVASDKSTEGMARMIIATSQPISGSADIMQVVLKVKEGAAVGNTTVVLESVNTAITNDDGTFEGELAITDSEKTVEIVSYLSASDINGDGNVTLSDLSMAVKNYQSDNAQCDVDRNGVVDASDLIIITGFIA